MAAQVALSPHAQDRADHHVQSDLIMQSRALDAMLNENLDSGLRPK